MKALFIYCKKFGFTPTVKTVETAAESSLPQHFENVEVAFIHAEEEDKERGSEIEKKLLKNLKWVCGKNQVNKVILHSFAHLSESKADPGFTKQLLDNTEERMANAGYSVSQTPFGYFMDLQVDAPGFSLARVFKNI